ncbi:MAG: pilus (MSHA type) biogenesis protein MshL [Burkholderiaceae bacterium]|nr:MAG: pilus (MSHA type) biogenesis protein MshL [Burkholderiaceae bacterium]
MAGPGRSLAKAQAKTQVAHISLALALVLTLTACSQQQIKPSSAHLGSQANAPVPSADSAPIPAPVLHSPLPPKPRQVVPTETFSVVVTNVDAAELLFALARDAKLNIDVHPGISGTVTLNAINQTLQQLLDRIARQIDMRYELNGGTLTILPDTPYLKNYRIDYLNMARNASTQVNVATQVSTTGSGATENAAGSAAGANNSLTTLSSSSNNRFWETLVANVRDLLRETDKILPDGSSETTTEQSGTQSTSGTGAQPPRSTRSSSYGTSIAESPNPATLQSNAATVVRRTTFREAAAVIANPESGVLAVRATSRQHEKVQEFLDQVMQSARRQVLIEATVVEVQLSDQYQQGINWGALRAGKGWSIAQQPLGAALSSGSAINSGPGGTVFPQLNSVSTAGGNNPSLLVLRYLGNAGSASIAAAVSLLESYGKVRVLSSPKLSVLNNQTALLKVVDNKVYFTVQSQVTPGNNNSNAVTTFTTTVHTVPVGFVMSVTPQIEPSGMVSVDVRPTISRIIGYVNDPNPSLGATVSRIPEVQTRELESILRVQTGNIAIMGGLMQDSVSNNNDAIPGASSIPVIGSAFKYSNQLANKNELVIFLRPVVLLDASLEGDLKNFKALQPQEDFFLKEDRLRQGIPSPAEESKP